MQRLPDTHLTHLVRLFPHRSPRRSSANAAEGGLDYLHPPALAPAPGDGPGVVVGEVPQPAPALQARPDLAARIAAAEPGGTVVRSVTEMRGVGKTQLAAARAPRVHRRGLAGGRLDQRRRPRPNISRPGRRLRPAGSSARTAPARRSWPWACAVGWKPTGTSACWSSTTPPIPARWPGSCPPSAAARSSSPPPTTPPPGPAPACRSTCSRSGRRRRSWLSGPAGRRFRRGRAGCRPGLPAAGPGPGRRGDRCPAPGLPRLPDPAARRPGPRLRATCRWRPLPALFRDVNSERGRAGCTVTSSLT